LRLHKLEVFGFKSFADRTIFEFQPGLTAFVGPNGCGKSNIVDAVKWVLGEQSARSLRGTEMTDVIFNGSEGRKSLGFAEASLTVVNNDRSLPVDYEEVRVTRRLYRSGESEYLLNNQPCRLRDIRELFMDTGIGMDAYSVIEQGKVDILINANSQDRRAIFEEAAGISKFKAQKKQALAKLERVEQNLVRLGDIIEEVDRQLRSIKRQASTARRYKEIADQLRQTRIALALHRYDEFTRGLADARRRIQTAADERQLIVTRIEALDAEKSELDAAALDLDKTLTRLQNADMQLQGRFRATEDGIKFNRERIQELQLSETKLANEVSSIRGRLAFVKHDLVAAIDEVARIREDLSGRTDKLQAIRAELRQLSQVCTDLAKQVDEQRAVVLELMRLMSRTQNELTSLGAERRGLQARRSRLEDRQQQIASELAQTNIERESVSADLLRCQQERADTQRETEEHLLRRDAINRRVQELGDQLSAQRGELTSLQSRMELLEDLEEKHEGLDAGTRYVLEHSRREGSELRGIRGMVADLMETELPHALAIEAALGNAVQHIVAESFDHAVSAIRHLRETQQGRASFLSIDRLRPRLLEAPDPAAHAGMLGRARDLVRCHDGIGPVFDHLLGPTLVVENLDRAVEMSGNGLRDWRLVTLDGEIIEPGGAISGGKIAGRTGLITRKAELREVAERIAALRTTIAQLEDELVNCSHQRDSIELRIEQLRDRASELAVAISQKSQQIARLDEIVARLSDEQQVGRSELGEISGQLQEIVGKEDHLRQEMDRIRADEQAVEAKVNDLEAERQRTEQQRAQLDEAATELKVYIAQRTERCESLEAATHRMRSNIEDLKREMLSALAEIDQCQKRRAEAAAAIEQKQLELGDIARQRDAVNTQQVDATNRRQEVRMAADDNAARQKQARAAIAQADNEIQELRLAEHDLQTRLEDLDARTRDAYEADLKQLLNTYAAPQDADWAAMEREADELQGKLKAMGAVNLNAISEQEELEQRSSFLTTQRDDLDKSRQQLMEVIRKINRQSREMFEQTFHAIRENFQQTFRKLFGGGKADIVLEEDKDILEAGVDIIARPPGKEPRSISLLSGGEKSLTAVALLFAIFRSKPSPFCILDEVDAALDEDNTERFASMVREYLKDSQFIVVTHSRRTMGMADVLYGITMQDSGVSKKVSVKFANMEQKVA
jgi:chromosome segregation protein